MAKRLVTLPRRGERGQRDTHNTSSVPLSSPSSGENERVSGFIHRRARKRRGATARGRRSPPRFSAPPGPRLEIVSLPVEPSTRFPFVRFYLGLPSFEHRYFHMILMYSSFFFFLFFSSRWKHARLHKKELDSPSRFQKSPNVSFE